MRTLHDIYRCIRCGFIAAFGNAYCRECGVKFSVEDIAEMQSNTRPVLGAAPWNLRDVYRCVHCSQHIALADKYCRRCGDKIDDNEKQLMKLRMTEIAKDNTPALVGLMLFVLLVVGMLVLVRL